MLTFFSQSLFRFVDSTMSNKEIYPKVWYSLFFNYLTLFIFKRKSFNKITIHIARFWFSILVNQLPIYMYVLFCEKGCTSTIPKYIKRKLSNLNFLQLLPLLNIFWEWPPDLGYNSKPQLTNWLLAAIHLFLEKSLCKSFQILYQL